MDSFVVDKQKATECFHDDVRVLIAKQTFRGFSDEYIYNTKYCESLKLKVHRLFLIINNIMCSGRVRSIYILRVYGQSPNAFMKSNTMSVSYRKHVDL